MHQQDFVKELAQLEGHTTLDGMVCVADVQVKGKGRGENVWASPMGCLMFSFLSRYTDGRFEFQSSVVSICKFWESLLAYK